jgi:hypothetical protein
MSVFFSEWRGEGNFPIYAIVNYNSTYLVFN